MSPHAPALPLASSTEDPGRIRAGPVQTGMPLANWVCNAPVDPKLIGKASLAHPQVLTQLHKNSCMVGKAKNEADAAAGELPAQAGLGRQHSAHGWPHGSSSAGRQEKGTPQRDALVQPPLRPGPQLGAGWSWSALHGAATRAGARKQLQAGGCMGREGSALPVTHV